MEKYPETATERFDNANFHIKYCLLSLKKFISGNIIEIGAGCGSFTRNYYNTKIKSIVLTEVDIKNINELKIKFSNDANIRISNSSIENIKQKFDTILYFHVLEHIKDDIREIKNAVKK